MGTGRAGVKSKAREREPHTIPGGLLLPSRAPTFLLGSIPFPAAGGQVDPQPSSASSKAGFAPRPAALDTSIASPLAAPPASVSLQLLALSMRTGGAIPRRVQQMGFQLTQAAVEAAESQLLPLLLSPDATEELVDYCEDSAGGLRRWAPFVRGPSGTSAAHRAELMQSYKAASSSSSEAHAFLGGAGGSEEEPVVALGHPAAVVVFHQELSLAHAEAQGAADRLPFVSAGMAELAWVGRASTLAVQRQEQARLMQGIKLQSLGSSGAPGGPMQAIGGLSSTAGPGTPSSTATPRSPSPNRLQGQSEQGGRGGPSPLPQGVGSARSRRHSPPSRRRAPRRSVLPSASKPSRTASPSSAMFRSPTPFAMPSVALTPMGPPPTPGEGAMMWQPQLALALLPAAETVPSPQLLPMPGSSFDWLRRDSVASGIAMLGQALGARAALSQAPVQVAAAALRSRIGRSGAGTGGAGVG